MISITQDRATSAQIRDSFRQLANGKSFITEEDMRSGQMRYDEIEYLKANMPRIAEGYDYEGYLRLTFVA